MGKLLGNNAIISKIRTLLDEVPDPEIPVINVNELGVVRKIEVSKGTVTVTITPTYTGCPAMKMFETDIIEKLNSNGYNHVEIKTVLSPAWTTDWITDEAKLKLKEFGIVPPEKVSADKGFLLGKEKKMECPRCGSGNSQMISQFGSTACKALYKCLDCLEPFDYFKCI